VTVSAMRGGSYPVRELRMSGYKNNRLCWIRSMSSSITRKQNLTCSMRGEIGKGTPSSASGSASALRI